MQRQKMFNMTCVRNLVYGVFMGLLGDVRRPLLLTVISFSALSPPMLSRSSQAHAADLPRNDTSRAGTAPCAALCLQKVWSAESTF